MIPTTAASSPDMMDVPTVEHIRALFADEQFRLAAAELDRALRAYPNDTDLQIEKARLGLYRGGERTALESLLKLPVTPHSSVVARHLANHFQARILMAEKHNRRDPEAQRALARLGEKFEIDTTHVGIRLSACLIIKNEEAHLERCLSSLRGIVDEIVVVDTGSTDGSLAVAEKFGAKIGHFDWCDDFSAARNASLQLATGEWVLWIDADEELDPASAVKLDNARMHPQFGGFQIQIVNFTADGGDDTFYVHNPIRLFQRLPGVHFTGRIHEQICNSLKALGLPGANLDGAKLLHHGYRPSEMVAKDKINRTVALLRQEVLDQPEEPFHWFNLCNALFADERWAEAEHAGRTCARYLKPNDPYGTLAYQLLIGSMSAQDKLERALETCEEAEQRGFGGLLIDFERANVLLKLNRAEEALVAIDRCLAADWPEDMTGDRSIALFKRQIVRGQILALLSRYDEALKMFEIALEANRTYGPALYSKAATLEKAGHPKQAYEYFLAGREDAAVHQLCTKGAARTALKLGLVQQAAELYQVAWNADPRDYECWIGWIEAASAWGDSATVVHAYEAFVQHQEPTPDILVNWGRALQASGQLERALTVFTEAIKRDPDNANAYFNCGDLLYQLGEYADAAHLYESGLRHSPLHSEGWFVLGNCLARLNLPEGAKIAYGQALRLNPRHNGAKHNLESLAA